LSKFFRRGFWRVHLTDGLNTPGHILVLAAFTAVFGGLRSKINFDLFERREYAFGILKAADVAKSLGIPAITVCEFGVASGGGLRCMCRIASAVEKITGVKIKVVGFDTGQGMPPAKDFRDHPEYYCEGDYAPPDFDYVRRSLPSNGTLVIGEIGDTLPSWLSSFKGVIGFAAIDVDYYSSTMECLRMFEANPECLLPCTPVCFDDVLKDMHSQWAGELLAINEFNASHPMRKIAPYTNLRGSRIMKSANWLNQMFALHVLDHPTRGVENSKPATARTLFEWET
jgi:hypothetical protein